MKKYISICVLTIRREDELGKLLDSINNIEFDETGYSVEVIVVDNDENASAKSAVEKFKSSIRFPLKYVHQPVRGIPQSRNAAIKTAAKETDFIVFVDDDEVVDRDWLLQLVSTQEKTNADVVCGPVYSRFKSEIPEWIEEGKFFERVGYNSFPDCSEVYYRKIKTGNLLLRKSMLDKLNGPFDETMALTGGSDTRLALDLHKRNAKMVWAANANVYEWVPVSRTNAKWICKRAFRTANHEVFLRTIEKGSNQVVRVFTDGLLRFSFGIIAMPVKYIQSLFRGKHILVHHARILYRGAGMMSGCFGYRYNEYATIHN